MAKPFIPRVGDIVEIVLERDRVSRDVIRGKIVGVYYNRIIPEIDEIIMGKAGDPGLKLQIYKNVNGKWRPTHDYFGVVLSELARIGQFQHVQNEEAK